jgi:crotonobetainyl-CoA:carnitine CoA-transferase CaiB-like acyl-CoA transferase
MGSELLKGYRMLDLTDEKGALCGKIFADMGADVIKVEPRAGCSTRRIPPFLDDIPSPDRSTYALAYHAGKRSVALDLESVDGRERMTALARSADFLVEAFPLGYLDSIGLGYEALARINPRLIYTSITPFGDKGPGRNYKWADIISWAAGGMMFLMGEEGRPPLQMSLPQAGLHAGAEAAVASLIAHYPREMDGLGQHIVVDMQACVVSTLMNEQAMPLLHGDYLRRTGIFTGAIGGRRKTIFACKDGYISFLIAGGAYLNSTNAMIAWLKEEGAGPDWMLKAGGLKVLTPGAFMSATAADLSELDLTEEVVESFFKTKSKREIWSQILKRRLFAAPCATVADVAADNQLEDRNYFVDVEQPRLGRKLRLPGAFAKLSATPVGPAGPAPQIGEHNNEIDQTMSIVKSNGGARYDEMSKAPTRRYALEGIHLLDFTWYGVGPVTTKYLADNGADVIRIESAARLDGLRLAPPWKDAKPGVNNSQFFASYNTSKKGITLDMNKPQAREIFLKLLPWADVVSESFTPKTLRNWRVDYEHLRELKPNLIMLSTCMQGQTGPNRDYPGFGNLMAALSGFYYIAGYSEGAPPCPPYGAYTDFIAPRFAACALIAALDYKRRTGVGQYIDMAQYEAALHNLAPAMIDYFATGRVLGPMANRSPRYAPHGAYRCADEDGHERWLALAVASDDEWAATLSVLGNPAADARFATMSGRLANPAALDAFIGELTALRSVDELTTALQAAGVAAYPVQNCMDLHRDENLAAFGYWHWLDHQHMGPSPYEGLQHRMSRTPGDLRTPAPVLGQHNEEILGGLLGMSTAEIARLKDEKVVY